MKDGNYIYDQRQYRLMLAKIDMYLLGYITANLAFIDIDNLLDFLKYKDDDFMSKCKELLLDIDVNIYYLNEGHLGDKNLLKLDQEKIVILMRKVRALIETKIDSTLSHEDVKYRY